MTNQTSLLDQVKIGEVTITKVNPAAMTQENYEIFLTKIFGEKVPHSTSSPRVPLGGSIEAVKMALKKQKGPDVFFIAEGEINFDPLPKGIDKVISVFAAHEYEVADSLDSLTLLLTESCSINNMLIDLEKNLTLLGVAPIASFAAIFRSFTSIKTSQDLFGGATNVLYMPANVSKEEMADVCEAKVIEVFAKTLQRYKKNIELAYFSF